MTSLRSTVLWIGFYLILVLAPLFALLIGPSPPGTGFWWDFSMALGFAGMSMMGLQFFLTARFRRASAPFGIDIIYYFHRFMALLVLLVIVVHYTLIRLVNAEVLGTMNPLQAPAYLSAGRGALFCITLLVITSLWRKQLSIHYDEWRIVHIGLAVTAFVLALVHIEGVGYYIDAPPRRWLWTAYSLLWLLLIVNVRVLKPWRLRTRPWRVIEVRRELGRSWTLALEAIEHGGLAFKPGQFAWLTLRRSPWRMKEHPFSIASSAMESRRVEFTIKELGNFTRHIGETKVGDLAYLDGPYGVFSVDQYPDAPGFVFIAGGVGAAPVMSMLRTLADRHDKRPLWFIYGNRHLDNIIFREQLEALRPRLNLSLVHVLKQPPENWNGETGQITPELLKKVLPETARECEYFLCGPKPMGESVQRGLHEMKVWSDQVHFELFDMV